MDLEKLKIDRSASAPRARRRGLGRWLLRVVLLGAVAVGFWTFRRPILELADRWRLSHVRVVEVTRASALSAAALSGTAANGYIVPRVRAALSADTPGRIVELRVREGSVVHAGDVVAQLYSEEYESALAAAEAEVASARATHARLEAELATVREATRVARTRVEAAAAQTGATRSEAELAGRELERLQKLYADGFATAQAVDQAASALQRSQALLLVVEKEQESSASEVVRAQRAEEASAAAVAEAAARIPVMEALRAQAAATLAKTTVRAPFDGVVVLKDAEVGEVVSPNSLGGNSRGSVATMVDFSSLEVQVELPEASIAGVTVGDEAAIFLDSYPKDRYEGRVDRIWPTANRQKATIEVRVVFLAPDERLRPEMGVRVVFSPSAEPAPAGSEEVASIRLPAACLRREGARTSVLVVAGGKLRLTTVEVGPVENGRVVIRSGLEEGERVVLDPDPSLADGERVIVEE